MSSQGFGFFNAQDGGDTADSIKRRIAYAQALQEQGMASPGNAAYGGLANAGKSIIGALLAKDANKAQQSKYADLLNSTLGKPELNDVVVTPQITDPGFAAAQAKAQNTPTESYNGPMAQQMGQGNAAKMAMLLQAVGPEAGTSILTNQLAAGMKPTEYDPTPQYDQNGNAFLVGKDGTRKSLDGIKARTKVEVTNGTAYDPYNTAPGKTFADQNKPFNPDGTPNAAYQKYEMDKSQKGAPVTNLSVSTDRSFGSELGGGAAKILDASSAAARGGVQALETVANIKAALDSGKVAAGPGATAIQFFNQIAGGDPQKVVATRQAIQGLAQLTMAGRQSLKGQGQISDYEGKLLQRATSGDIDSMTVPEIRAIADVADRNARIAIRLNKEMVDKARKVPGSGNVVDFYDVNEPADGWGKPRLKGQ